MHSATHLWVVSLAFLCAPPPIDRIESPGATGGLSARAETYRATEDTGRQTAPATLPLDDVHARRMSGYYEEAIEGYQRLLAPPGRDTTARGATGGSSARAASDRAGTDPGRQAANATPPEERVEAACGLAACYLETGLYAGARRVLRSVEKEGSDAGLWRRTMAETLAAVGQYRDAIGHAQHAVKLDTNDLQARYQLGRLYETVGELDQAVETYRFFDQMMLRRLPTRAPKLTAAAGGFLRYSVLTRHPNLSNRTTHTLQEFYQPAYERLDRTYWPARLASGDLLRSKFQHEQSAEDYKAALAINENLAAAHVGLGRIALDKWDFEEADRRIHLARSRNPASVPAFQLEAALRLTERRFTQAKAAADRALAINPNDVASLGLAAAAGYCLNDHDGVEAGRKRAYDVTPTPSEFHRIIGDTLGALRRYAASEEQYKLAIKADPTDPHPRTELGLMYMQWGREKKARDALAAAWELDDFDARTFNTLNLLDRLSSFARHETEHFIIRYAAPEDAVLPMYFADYLESIFDEICDDYQCTPAEKTIIEFLPTHRMFGVRITGKPWIHTVGACTGRVIALDSPRRDPQLRGPYNVANVLRHEFTHTVTLAASDNRIAHWFTEGLAVLQEDHPRSFDWSQLLAETVRRDRLFTLESIDWGFIRPRHPNDRQLAYAQSEWMCEYIIQRFGYDSLNKVIDALRRHSEKGAPSTSGARDGPRQFSPPPLERVGHQSAAVVMTEALGIEPEQFDADFAAWARGQVKSWGFDLTLPEHAQELRAMVQGDDEDPNLYGRLARAEFDEGNIERALEAARDGLAGDEHNVLSLTVLGKVLSIIRGNRRDPQARRTIDDELAPAMERLLRLAPDSWIAPKVLGTIALERKDHSEALKHFTRLKRVCPMDSAGDRGLAGVYLDRKRYDLALPHLLQLARSEERDPDVASTIAFIYARKDRLPESRYWYTQSLYIDPFNIETHEALASVFMRMEDTRGAIKEYETLCTLEPNVIKYFEQAATAFDKIGDRSSSRHYAAKAVQLDPATPVRTMLPD